MTGYAAALNEQTLNSCVQPSVGKVKGQVKTETSPQSLSKDVKLTDLSDADLMERVVANDQLAYQEIVKRHFEKMYALAYRMVNQAADAEDIAQDVFF